MILQLSWLSSLLCWRRRRSVEIQGWLAILLLSLTPIHQIISHPDRFQKHNLGSLQYNHDQRCWNKSETKALQTAVIGSWKQIMNRTSGWMGSLKAKVTVVRWQLRGHDHPSVSTKARKYKITKAQKYQSTKKKNHRSTKVHKNGNKKKYRSRKVKNYKNTKV